MSNLVERAMLSKHLNDPSWVIVDCRFMLGKPDAGRAAYAADHLPGAVYFDLEQDLSGEVSEHGGRHPLPDLGVLTIKLGAAGIDETKTVVAYDDQGGAMASRFWWLLHFLGHPQVNILTCGYSRWKAEGEPISMEVPAPVPTTFSPQINPRLLASMEEVRDKLGSETILLDSREKVRYVGEQEPIDRIAGHIPGARHAFWKDNLNSEGDWMDSRQLQERFRDLPGNREIIVYCGSGVTACPNMLALNEAGYTNVKLYSGSWSDWISYAENPIATGEE